MVLVQSKGWEKVLWRQWVSYFVLISLIVSIVYSFVQIMQMPPEPNAINDSNRPRSDYVLMLLQCVLGVIVFFLPSLLEHRLKLQIPSNMYLAFIIFLYFAIYLGEVRNFYYIIPHWDDILHAFSAAMLGALGFSIVSLLNENQNVGVQLSPAFVAMFAFCFALSMGAVWEIYEYLADGLLGTNMQKYALENGTLLLGHAALADTMKDIVVDCIGALAISLVGYASLKYEKGWLEHFSVTRKQSTHEQ